MEPFIFRHMNRLLHKAPNRAWYMPVIPPLGGWVVQFLLPSVPPPLGTGLFSYSGLADLQIHFRHLLLNPPEYALDSF